MKITLARIVIVTALAVQVFYIIQPRFGSNPPSARVRLAIESNLNNSKADLNKEIAEAKKQDAVDGDRRAMAELALILGVNVTVVYFSGITGSQKKPLPAT